MAEFELRGLADTGIREFPPARFEQLAAACRENARATASSRLFAVAETIDLLAQAWEPHDAVPADLVDRLDQVLAADLPVVLAEPDEHAATALAAAMRESVALVLTQQSP